MASEQARALVVVGASGFVGAHLLARASTSWAGPIWAVSRRPLGAMPPRVTPLRTTLENLASVDREVPAGAVVVNLTFASSGGEAANRSLLSDLARLCDRIEADRLVHVSTAMVIGTGGTGWVTEETPCRPVTSYQRIKLLVEQELEAWPGRRWPVVVLRPTAVFGTGGRNLEKLTNDLTSGSVAANVLRAALFGRRPMHLVPIETVVEALLFAAASDRALRDARYLVAADDSEANNFRDVEDVMRRAFGLPRPRVPLPPVHVGLDLALRVTGRRVLRPGTRFSSDRLRQAGCAAPVPFVEALERYARELAGGRGRVGRHGGHR